MGIQAYLRNHGGNTEGSIITAIILNWRPKMHSNLLFRGKAQRQCLFTENNWVNLMAI